MVGGVGAGVLAPPEGLTTEDLGGDPLPWTESMGTGGPLLYAGMLRWQASALEVCVCWGAGGDVALGLG